MKHKSILFCLLFVLLFAVPWKATASSTHLMGTITIYVDEQKTIYRDSKYIPSNYYVSDDGWFIRQKTGSSWIDRQEFYDVKIISKNSQSCTILGLQSNYDPYGLTTTELHCKGTRQSIGEYEEMVWKIEVKSYGYLRVEASPAGGTVDAGTKVTLTATSNGNTVSGCDIYYTLDGSTPTKSSTKYTSSGVTIEKSCWLNAKAFKTGYESIHVDEWYYYVSPVIAEVNETNFPDENFRNWILAQDYGKDGKLTQGEIKGVTRIGVSGTYDSPGNIKSLKGIEYFTALTTLYCHYNQLTSLDVSKNTELKWLYCHHNKITNLNLSNNTKLLNLECNDNQLTALDVSNSVSLTNLDCYGNQLTTLDVSKNTALTYLSCYNNKLNSLDVSKSTLLKSLYCYNNQLQALDVSKNTALNSLSCQNNKLNSLDLSSNTALTFINCFGNGISTIDVSKNINLETLACQANNLTTLDVSNNKKINWLLIHHNKIKGSAMDNLIASLPVNTTEERYTFYVVSDDDVLSGIQLEPEGNVCTKAQVAALKAKGWTATKNGGEYEGSEEVLYDKGVTDISKMDNVIYIEPVEVRTGDQVTLSLRMKNSVAIRGFQFDLYLPEGVTVVKSSKGRIQGALSEGRLPAEDEHDLTFSEQQDGAIRFLCSSQYDETFTGSDGEIATLQVSIGDDMAEGDYPIQLKGIKLTETNISIFHTTELVQSRMTVVSFVTGDINNDGIVDVSDYTGVANHIHGNTPEGFNAKAADVNDDGIIDVSDYTGIANIIHTGSVYGKYSKRHYTFHQFSSLPRCPYTMRGNH